MPYTPVLATLGYVFSPDLQRVLLVHRNRRPDDFHFGKFNGLGGKLESGEEVVAGMKREILEEAGISCTTLELRGTISWPGFGKNGQDWFGFLFRITSFEGEPFKENAEGELTWIEVDRVPDLNLWDGDRHFLPLMFSPAGRPFHGVMPYSEGKPVSWNYSLL